jgi:hypothetical protein
MAYGAHRLALIHMGIPLYRNRAQMDERDRVAVVCADRQREAARRHRAGERHRTGAWGEHGLAGLSADVDAAMLAAQVRVVPERERTENGTRSRPCPRPRRRGKQEQEQEHEAECSQSRQHASIVGGRILRCQIWLQFRHKERR